nr:MAG TPA: hypothetical protein [Caudoviricetes sp.]
MSHYLIVRIFTFYNYREIYLLFFFYFKSCLL